MEGEQNKELIEKLLTRDKWCQIGYRVPSRAEPREVEEYQVPRRRNLWKQRHLFAYDQVVKVDREKALAHSIAAEKAVETRMANMEEKMRTVELTIQAGKSPQEIYRRAFDYFLIHNPNSRFYFSNYKARCTIRHHLTNYEAQWRAINRGYTGELAYRILRERIDALVAETYPEFGEDMPEVRVENEGAQ